ncbi:heavy-metal-associated domain-containing protein [Demequina globuliformis]|uniref:heavy-metal-associated domain-containing protein n=1 Tax=Demequina globuliformis TaxID=676202 RepID=UPI000784A681|nr:heavy metal-associated domain-containing protein [Demequina globuliformis]
MTDQPIITVTVTGMTCGGCAANVRTALEQADGIAAAHVDHESGRVDVTPDGTVPADDLEFTIDEAVAGAGYAVKS